MLTNYQKSCDALDSSVIELPDTPSPNAPTLLRPVGVADIYKNPPMPPQFIWDGYLPRGVVTLFGAHGGTGKSMLALMLAVSAALGRSLFGIQTTRCKTVFASLEDGEGIVRWRLAQICECWVVDPSELDGWLTIVDGTDSPELFACEGRGAGEETSSYFELEQLAADKTAGLLIVDNASDAYGGDEIQRRQVRAFMRSLGRIAKQNNSVVLLLAHVDKQTSRSKRSDNGEGYSGSTAWHNSARSRIFMSRSDSGQLTLEHQKSNFGKKRDPIHLTWRDGGLPELESNSPNFDGLSERLNGRMEDQRAAELLKLMAEYEQRGHYCSTSSTSPTNPFKVFFPDPIFKKMRLKREDVARLLLQSERAGWIERFEFWTKDRKLRERWTLTKLGRDWAGVPAPSAPTSIDDAHSACGAEQVAPSAPTCVGGMGGGSAEITSDKSFDCEDG